MKEIRIHGRGGQGVVTAAELIAIAAFKSGQEAQAFPSFGVERTGAPIESYARIDNKKIRTRQQVRHPHFLIIQDASLVQSVDVSLGANENTIIIINSQKKATDFSFTTIKATNIHVIDATQIALDILGVNLANTVLLGYFAKISGLISLQGLKEAIQEKFADKDKAIINKNLRAAKKAYALN